MKVILYVSYENYNSQITNDENKVEYKNGNPFQAQSIQCIQFCRDRTQTRIDKSFNFLLIKFHPCHVLTKKLYTIWIKLIFGEMSAFIHIIINNFCCINLWFVLGLRRPACNRFLMIDFCSHIPWIKTTTAYASSKTPGSSIKCKNSWYENICIAYEHPVYSTNRLDPIGSNRCIQSFKDCNNAPVGQCRRDASNM